MPSDDLEIRQISRNIYGARATVWNAPPPALDAVKAFLEAQKKIQEVVAMQDSVLLLRDGDAVKGYALKLDVSYTVTTPPAEKIPSKIVLRTVQALLGTPATEPQMYPIGNDHYEPVYLLHGGEEAELLDFAVQKYTANRTDAERGQYQHGYPLLWPIPGNGFYELVEAIEEITATLTPLEDAQIPRYDVYEARSYLRLARPVLFREDNLANRGSGMVIYLTSGADPESIQKAFKKLCKEFPSGFVSLEQGKMYWVTDGTVAAGGDLPPLIDPIAYHRAATTLQAEVDKLHHRE